MKSPLSSGEVGFVKCCGLNSDREDGLCNLLSCWTVFSSSSDVTSIKVFLFCGYWLALCHKCEEAEWDAKSLRCTSDNEGFGIRDMSIIVLFLLIIW